MNGGREIDEEQQVSKLSVGMLNFLDEQELKSKIQAFIDAARELGINDFSKEDAIKAIEIEEQEDNSHG